MNVSQVLNHINDNNYDDDITITEIAKGHFPAVTGNTYDPDNAIRHVRVDLLSLEQAPGGTQQTNSGLYVRQEGEHSVITTVYQDDRELASNTQNYS